MLIGSRRHSVSSCASQHPRFDPASKRTRWLQNPGVSASQQDHVGTTSRTVRLKAGRICSSIIASNNILHFESLAILAEKHLIGLRVVAGEAFRLRIDRQQAARRGRSPWREVDCSLSLKCCSMRSKASWASLLSVNSSTSAIGFVNAEPVADVGRGGTGCWTDGLRECRR